MEPIGPRTTSSERNILLSNAISAARIADGIRGKTPLINGTDQAISAITKSQNSLSIHPGNSRQKIVNSGKKSLNHTESKKNIAPQGDTTIVRYFSDIYIHRNIKNV